MDSAGSTQGARPPRPPELAIDGVEARAYRIPTDKRESDGTFAWRSTTLVCAHARAGDRLGFGYSYGSAAVVTLIHEQLAGELLGVDALAPERAHNALLAAVRNVGRPGIAACAISALDIALWDLKAKLLGLPLYRLLGEARAAVEVYGSGGFTSYGIDELCEQLAGWASRGITRVKMKVGSEPERDVERVAAARAALPPATHLMVDANGAYRTKQALDLAGELARLRVDWFEEPVSSDDLAGLRLLRERAPAGLAIAAGEYGYDLPYFRRMLQAGAVDVLQADATRCLGVSGFMAAARLCQAFGIPLSAHTAPSLHAQLGCAATPLLHVEYFYDHVRIEQALFDGFVAPIDGRLRPDRTRPGLGVDLKQQDAARYAI